MAEQAYRDAPPRCPGCGSLMNERGPADARIDLCRACGGLWLDWFDGDAAALARAVDQAGVPVAGGVGRGTCSCPRCQTRLVAERFRGEAGPEVERCPDCQGLYLSRDALKAVAGLDPAGGPERPVPGLVDQVVEILRGLLGQR